MKGPNRAYPNFTISTGQNDDLIKQLQPFVIMSGVALLLLLLLCNFISVLQRR